MEMYSLISCFYLSKFKKISYLLHIGRHTYTWRLRNQQGIDKCSQTNYFTYSKGELHHRQNMDLGCLPICGYTLLDLLRFQTAHGVVFVPGQAHLRPQNLRKGCK